MRVNVLRNPDQKPKRHDVCECGNLMRKGADHCSPCREATRCKNGYVNGLKEYRSLPFDEQAAVDRMIAGRPYSFNSLLVETLQTLRRALECEAPCCKGKSKAERLEDL